MRLMTWKSCSGKNRTLAEKELLFENILKTLVKSPCSTVSNQIGVEGSTYWVNKGYAKIRYAILKETSSRSWQKFKGKLVDKPKLFFITYPQHRNRTKLKYISFFSVVCFSASISEMFERKKMVFVAKRSLPRGYLCRKSMWLLISASWLHGVIHAELGEKNAVWFKCRVWLILDLLLVGQAKWSVPVSHRNK